MVQRARLFLLVAVVIAAGILVANFPLGALLHDRATVQGESARLAALRATNERLASEVRALDEPAIIGQIAHEEYGLVTPGAALPRRPSGISRLGQRGARPAREQPDPLLGPLAERCHPRPGHAGHAAAGARSGLLAPRARQPGVLALAVLTAPRPAAPTGRRSGLRPGGGGTIVSRPVRTDSMPLRAR